MKNSPAGNAVVTTHCLISSGLADCACVIVFALFARIAHQSDLGHVTLLGVLETAWPFIVGALLGSALTTLRGWEPNRLVPSGIGVWIVTVVSGIVIMTTMRGHVPHWSMQLISTIFLFFILLAWRFGYQLLVKKRTLAQIFRMPSSH